jgi:hypothetical protein
VKGIQVCPMKGQVLFKGGDIHKNIRIGWGHLRNLSLKNYEARKAELYMKAF